MDDAKTVLGRFLRHTREHRGLSQQQLASDGGVSYQYLSAVEGGKENFTLGVLEGLLAALSVPLPHAVIEAYHGATSASPPPIVNPSHFRPGVPLPVQLTTDHLATALNETQRLVHLINASLTATGGQPLAQYIQANNFSGIVSNVLCHALHGVSPYRHNSHQRYPDLVCHDERGSLLGGLEVKTTIKPGKGGESHNAHSGWHLVGCFRVLPESGDVEFLHVMLADLISHHAEPDGDWKYVKSVVNVETGSQRTETYVTTPRGTAKLRHGTAFIHPDVVFKRWKRHPGEVPPHSIFFTG